MARKDLNIVLGIDTRAFDKSLGRVQRSLDRFAFKTQSIGRNLSQSLTLPILAVGAAAISSFAQFDKMSKGLAAIAGSAEEAEKQMTSLRVLAQNPGIDLIQAVKGTIKLQAVGLAAKEAEETLLQFSKAVTLGGGTADDLGEVTRQLTQMISKGKILSIDFKVIADRVPAVGLALQDAFGTQSIEKIRNTGISARNFVKELTGAIRESKTFQSVQGGLANSFDNFKQAITASLVELGESIDKSINLKQVLNNLAGSLQSAVTFFKNLDESTKSLIVRFALWTAAAGPAIFALGKFITVGTSLIKLFRLLRTGFFDVIKAVRTFAASFSGLKTAGVVTKLGLVGLALAAVGVAYLLVKNRIDKLTEGSRRLNQITVDGTKAVEREGAKVRVLIKVLQDENKTRASKERALRLLKVANKEYFKDVRFEGDEIVGLAGKYKAYAANILLVAKAKAAQKQFDEVSDSIEKLTEEIETGGTFLNKIKNSFLGVAGAAKGMELNAKSNNDELDRLVKIRDKIIAKKFEFEDALSPDVKKTATGGGGDTIDVPEIDEGAAEKALAFAEKFRKRLNEARKNGVEPLVVGVTNLNEEFKNLDFGFSIASLDAKDLKVEEQVEALARLKAAFEGVSQVTIDLGFEAAGVQLEDLRLNYDLVTEAIQRQINTQEKLNNKLERQREIGEGMTNVMGALGNAFGTLGRKTEDGLKRSEVAFKALKTTAVAAIADIIGLLIKQAIAGLIASLVTTLGPVGLALAAGAGAAVSGLIKSAFASIPKLAQGGVIPPGFPNDTFPAFLSSGETVIPTGKLPDFGGAGGFVAETRIDLRELIIGIRREENSLGRIE